MNDRAKNLLEYESLELVQRAKCPAYTGPNSRPWYGRPYGLCQDVICKYGEFHIVGVGSAVLIDWPEGYECGRSCQDITCVDCQGAYIGGNTEDDQCTTCNGFGKVSPQS